MFLCFVELGNKTVEKYKSKFFDTIFFVSSGSWKWRNFIQNFLSKRNSNQQNTQSWENKICNHTICISSNKYYTPSISTIDLTSIISPTYTKKNIYTHTSSSKFDKKCACDRAKFLRVRLTKINSHFRPYSPSTLAYLILNTHTHT